MRRVLVIGPGGAGKSTFARRLGAMTGLPVVHLDRHYWRAGWVEPSPAAWTESLDTLLAGPAWIMDGNYGGSLERRLVACDTVVLLDLSRWTCLWRVLMRRLRHHGRARPDMTADCPERLTGEFLAWIWTYPVRRRPRVLQRMAALRANQRFIRLDSRAAVDGFLASVADQVPRRAS